MPLVALQLFPKLHSFNSLGIAIFRNCTVRPNKVKNMFLVLLPGHFFR